jgi:hypothetical protein
MVKRRKAARCARRLNKGDLGAQDMEDMIHTTDRLATGQPVSGAR